MHLAVSLSSPGFPFDAGSTLAPTKDPSAQFGNKYHLLK